MGEDIIKLKDEIRKLEDREWTPERGLFISYFKQALKIVEDAK